MQGIISNLPADKLSAALMPISHRIEPLAWAVDLQSGPLQFPFADESDPRNLIAWHKDAEGLPMGWFRSGFFPQHADSLVLDEWSYYLGFDPQRVTTNAIAHRIGFNKGLSPRKELFGAVKDLDLIYILRIDIGWWEAYTPDVRLLDLLKQGLTGKEIDSERWKSGMPNLPGDGR